MPKNTPLASELFKFRYSQIKDFVAFDYSEINEPTTYQKRKVREYFHELEAHLWTTNFAAPLPDDKRAQTYLKKSGYKKRGYKAVPFRTPPNIIKEIEFTDDGTIKTETKFGEYEFISFDSVKGATSEKYLDDFFSQFDDSAQLQISISDDRGVYGGYNTPSKCREEISNLMQRYSVGGTHYKRKRREDGTYWTNHHKKWLNRVNVLTPKNGKVSNTINFNKVLSNAKNTNKAAFKELKKQHERKIKNIKKKK